MGCKHARTCGKAPENAKSSRETPPSVPGSPPSRVWYSLPETGPTCISEFHRLLIESRQTRPSPLLLGIHQPCPVQISRLDKERESESESEGGREAEKAQEVAAVPKHASISLTVSFILPFLMRLIWVGSAHTHLSAAAFPPIVFSLNRHCLKPVIVRQTKMQPKVLQEFEGPPHKQTAGTGCSSLSTSLHTVFARSQNCGGLTLQQEACQGSESRVYTASSPTSPATSTVSL